MTTTRSLFTKAVRPALLMVALGAAMGGCAYSGVATTPDGTVILARNGLFGSLRKIYICKVAGNSLNCVESATSP